MNSRRCDDRIEIQPGSYFDCAVWTANHLVIEGLGDPNQVVIAGNACQGKALIVTVGEGITIRNLTLTLARVPDGNGAGIRAEGRDLVVERVRFVDNENGLLSGIAGGTIVIRDSLFDRNGTCLHACAHGVYAGHLDMLRIENTQFIGTRQGHHIKSRARRTEILGCAIEDGADGTASFEIELPNGGSLLARGNTMRKGPKSDNHGAMISIGAEGVTQPTLEIVLEDNIAHSDGQWDTYLLRDHTSTAAVLRGNRLSGALKALRVDGSVNPP